MTVYITKQGRKWKIVDEPKGDISTDLPPIKIEDFNVKDQKRLRNIVSPEQLLKELKGRKSKKGKKAKTPKTKALKDLDKRLKKTKSEVYKKKKAEELQKAVKKEMDKTPKVVKSPFTTTPNAPKIENVVLEPNEYTVPKRKARVGSTYSIPSTPRESESPTGFEEADRLKREIKQKRGNANLFAREATKLVKPNARRPEPQPKEPKEPRENKPRKLKEEKSLDDQLAKARETQDARFRELEAIKRGDVKATENKIKILEARWNAAGNKVKRLEATKEKRETVQKARAEKKESAEKAKAEKAELKELNKRFIEETRGSNQAKKFQKEREKQEEKEDKKTEHLIHKVQANQAGKRNREAAAKEIEEGKKKETAKLKEKVVKGFTPVQNAVRRKKAKKELEELKKQSLLKAETPEDTVKLLESLLPKPKAKPKEKSNPTFEESAKKGEELVKELGPTIQETTPTKKSAKPKKKVEKETPFVPVDPEIKKIEKEKERGRARAREEAERRAVFPPHSPVRVPSPKPASPKPASPKPASPKPASPKLSRKEQLIEDRKAKGDIDPTLSDYDFSSKYDKIYLKALESGHKEAASQIKAAIESRHLEVPTRKFKSEVAEPKGAAEPEKKSKKKSEGNLQGKPLMTIAELQKKKEEVEEKLKQKPNSVKYLQDLGAINFLIKNKEEPQKEAAESKPKQTRLERLEKEAADLDAEFEAARKDPSHRKESVLELIEKKQEEVRRSLAYERQRSKPEGSGLGGKLKGHQVNKFVEASYKNLDDANNVGDYVLDRELSTKNNKVYKDPATGKVVIANAGTSSLGDWWNNKNILFGNYSKTKRYKEVEDIQKKAIAKYGKDNIMNVGHSQSGEALRIMKKNGLLGEAVAVNPAIIGKPTEGIDVIRSDRDLVSLLTPTQEGDTTIKATTFNPLTEHSSNIISGENEEKEFGRGMKSIFNKIHWGTFTEQFKRYRRTHPQIKDLEDFATHIITNPKEFNHTTLHRAMFYENVIKHKRS